VWCISTKWYCRNSLIEYPEEYSSPSLDEHCKVQTYFSELISTLYFFSHEIKEFRSSVFRWYITEKEKVKKLTRNGILQGRKFLSLLMLPGILRQ